MLILMSIFLCRPDPRPSGPAARLRCEAEHAPSPQLRSGLLHSSQCCGSGMFIPDPDFCPSRIPKKICCPTFFVATNITKLKIILFLNWFRKNLGQFTKNCRTFNQKIVTKLPGSGKTYFGSRIRIRNTDSSFSFFLCVLLFLLLSITPKLRNQLNLIKVS
jgi:hypothetical protein